MNEETSEKKQQPYAAEVAALNTVLKALEPLSDEARGRVLSYSSRWCQDKK